MPRTFCAAAVPSATFGKYAFDRAMGPLLCPNHPNHHLRAADGALGSHAALVTKCREDFEALARRIAAAAGVSDVP